MVLAKGAIEGGYHNHKYNKISIITNIRHVTDQMTAITTNINEMNGHNQQLDLQINEIIKDINRLEAEKDHLYENNNILCKEINISKKHLKELTQNMQNLQAIVASVEQDATNLEEQVNIYRRELKQKFVRALTEEDVNNIAMFETSINQANQQSSALGNELQSLQQRKHNILLELNNNLYKQKEETEYKLNVFNNASDNNIRDYSADINKLQIENEHLEVLVANIDAELAELQSNANRVGSQIQTLEQSIELKRQKEQSFTSSISEMIKENDKLLSKKNMHLETIQSKAKLIKDLGMLPQLELNKYKAYSVSAMIKELSSVNNRLGKYSNINRKALDQYISFNEQKQTLAARKEELEKDRGSIQLLIQNLDVQKDNTIVNTFHSVNTHFTNVFSELVPAGKARLVLRTNMDGVEEGEEEEGRPPAVDINSILGIGVEVSFMGTNNVHIYHSMQALSGGQKALVALALIFAIQRCDPAPFYLFDEIGECLSLLSACWLITD